MSLPQDPPRYICFVNIWVNPQRTETNWHVVENGFYASRGCSSFKEVMFFFGGDVPPATVYDEITERFVPLVLGA